VIDFTSSLYLGFRHSREELPGWPFLTAGKPAALWEPELARTVARQAAALQGAESGLVSTSTLHLFWDVLGWLADRRYRVHLDAGAYPIARWGVERAAGRGAPVARFRHYDANHLERSLGSDTGGRNVGGPPVVVADGFCPACGKLAPLADYLQCVRRRRGLLLIDDTQALGIFGAGASPADPYGRGGGGSLRAAGMEGEDDVIAISSLAKAFGTPLAVLTGSRRLVLSFDAASQTRMHCSPPSLAVLTAARHALLRNQRDGDRLRRRLRALVQALRSQLPYEIAHEGLFPVQTVESAKAEALHGQLLSHGIQTVLRASTSGRPDYLTILLTAAHSLAEVQTLTRTLQNTAEMLCPQL
jgi:8-amino-7-oxononanoate synthase